MPALSQRARRIASPLAYGTPLLGVFALIALLFAASHAPAQSGLPLPGSESAQLPSAEPTPADDAEPSVVRVSAALSASAAAPGQRLVALITLDFEKDWHVWPSIEQDVLPPEIAEFAIRTAVTPQLPAGVRLAGATQWPEPQLAPVPDITGSGKPMRVPTYKDKALIFLPLEIAGDAAPGPRTLSFRVDYQACDDKVCMAPEEVTVEVALEIASAAASPASAPFALSADRAASFATFDVARFSAPPTPTASAAAESLAADVAVDADAVHFNAFGIEFDIQTGSAVGLTLLLLVAALGGFILNLTPCVLPMIPLKILGLTRSAKDPARTLLLGLVMSMGVVAFWIAIGAAIAFVSGIDDVSALFQYWWFTVGVGLFIGGMAIGMLGLFTVGLPGWVYMINPSQDTVRGSFLFGIMTAVLATPCTAPFLGSAVGWATQQQPPVTLATFAAVGIGMALPYLVLAMFPRLVSRVPKSGPGSELVKQVMGLLMLAVAAFFIGSGLQTLAADVPYLGEVLHWWIVAIFASAAGLWLIVRTFQLTTSPARRAAFTLVGLLLGGAAVAWSVRLTSITARIHHIAEMQAQQAAARGQTGPQQGGLWAKYEPAAFQAALDRGDVVVLDFTASWCLNCKALKAAVLSRTEVEESLLKPGVSSFLADLSSRTAPGWTMLRQTLGRNTIPTLAVFGPGLERPFVSEAYTVDQVLTAIRQAAARP
ncbi:MAG: cytochrome c biogenesis protein CcdA [Planctomycetota bacterium]|nr:cytochrome c biogenesis protein CcdA [Planctomycetota bacterium]